MENFGLQLGSRPGFSSVSPLSFKTILKNQKLLTYKNIKEICKIICRYALIVRELTLAKYDSRNFKYRVRVNNKLHIDDYTTEIKISQFRSG